MKVGEVMIDSKDEFRYLVSGYFGIREMDDYDLKEYILKDIENYIKDFIKNNSIKDFDYKNEAEKIESEVPLERKLQDSLLVLNKIDAPIELKLMINHRLEKIKAKEVLSIVRPHLRHEASICR